MWTKRRAPAPFAAIASCWLPTALTRSKIASSRTHCSGIPIELKTSSHPSTAATRLSASVMSARTDSLPAGRMLAARFGSRTSARTWSPLSSRAEAIAWPTFPVAPVTRARIGPSYAGGIERLRPAQPLD